MRFISRLSMGLRLFMGMDKHATIVSATARTCGTVHSSPIEDAAGDNSEE
jgi:hypothetical protein